MSLEIKYQELPSIKEALKWKCLGQVDPSPGRHLGGFMYSQDKKWVYELPAFWEDYNEGQTYNPPISRQVSLGREGRREYILYENLLGEQLVISYEDLLSHR